MGMLDLLLEESLTTAQRAKVERARESAQALLAIINDILDLSKIEAGRLDLETVLDRPVAHSWTTWRRCCGRWRPARV